MARNIHSSIRNTNRARQQQQVPNPDAHFNDLFEQFVQSSTFRSVLGSFYKLCDALDIKPGAEFRHIYPQFKIKLTSWKAKSLWAKIDKRAQNREYKKGRACLNTRVFIIGCGPCGLRTAIETALLGAKTVIIEKRDRFSRNNVLHLWPFTITDLKNLGAKLFYGKFCAGSIDHIAIRQLQCMLLKIALLVGVQVYENVEFEDLIEPCCGASRNNSPLGWRAKVKPADHPVSQFDFDVIIGADGRRNTLDGTYTGGNPFPRKEFRGKLAIAITANFVNYNSQEEASVEEISGVAFIFNQKFFQDLREKTGIDLENIVYYKDETHYFVMTAKKQSLLQKGVIVEDLADTVSLLSRENVNQAKLLEYAKEAADFSTNYKMPRLEFARNHYGQSDVAMFDFTSIYAAENASYVLDRNGHKLLMGLVGDSLLEPFWPTGSGCARGFLGAYDAAWMVRNWSSNNMTPLEVIAERETIFKLLPQVTPENLHKDHNQYSTDPDSRYPNLNKKLFSPDQVTQLYNGGAGGATQHIIVETKTATLQPPSAPDRHPSVGTTGMFMSKLIHWCKDQVEGYDIEVKDMSNSWKSGLALCAIINRYRPDLLDFDLLNPEEVEYNNQIAFDIAEKELGIPPEMNGAEMANCDVPDRLTLTSYLTKIYELLKNEPVAVRRTVVEAPEEASRAKRARPIGSKPSAASRPLVPTLEVSAPVVVLPASLANHEFLVGSAKNDQEANQNQVPVAPVSKMGKPRVSILKSFTDSITKKKKTPEPSTSEAEYEANQGMDVCRPEEDICGNQIKEAELRPDSRGVGGGGGKSKVSSLAANLQKQFDRQQSAGPELPTKRLGGRPPTGKPPSGPGAQGTEVCYFCKTRVYVMERLSAEGLFFHRGCLRCDYCNTLLRLGNYAFERDPIAGSCHFYCVQHMGMKKVRLTRKRSINNSLVAYASSASTAAASAAASPAGRGGGGDLPPTISLTRERISLGTHSPLGSPTAEEMRLPGDGGAPAAALNGFFNSPPPPKTAAGAASSLKSPGLDSPERSSATPERVEFSFSTKTAKEEEEEEDEDELRVNNLKLRGAKGEEIMEEDEEDEEEEEETSSEEESSSEEETSSEEDSDEEEEEDEDDDDGDEEDEEDEDDAVFEEEASSKAEVPSASSSVSAKLLPPTSPSEEVAPPSAAASATKKSPSGQLAAPPETSKPASGDTPAVASAASAASAEDRASLSSASTESSFTISTPEEKPSDGSSSGEEEEEEEDDDDKMEFDDEEILGDVASVDDDDEPSSLPSPPFPIKNKDGASKTASDAATAATATAATASIESSQLPTPLSPRIYATDAAAASSPTEDQVTLSGNFKGISESGNGGGGNSEMDDADGSGKASPLESPTHFLPPQHLLSANRSKLSQLTSPSSFQKQFSHLAVKKAQDNMKRISVTEEEMRKLKDFNGPVNGGENAPQSPVDGTVEGSFPVEKGRKKLFADDALTNDLKGGRRREGGDGDASITTSSSSAAVAASRGGDHRGRSGGCVDSGPPTSSSKCSSSSSASAPPPPAGGVVEIPFVDEESESETESILDKSRRDDSASEQGSPCIAKKSKTDKTKLANGASGVGHHHQQQQQQCQNNVETTPKDNCNNNNNNNNSSNKTPAEEIRQRCDKMRQEARLKAKLKSDEEYGILGTSTTMTPAKTATTTTSSNRKADDDDDAPTGADSKRGEPGKAKKKRVAPAAPSSTTHVAPSASASTTTPTATPSSAANVGPPPSSSKRREGSVPPPPSATSKGVNKGDVDRRGSSSGAAASSKSSSGRKLSSRETSVDRKKRGVGGGCGDQAGSAASPSLAEAQRRVVEKTVTPDAPLVEVVMRRDKSAGGGKGGAGSKNDKENVSSAASTEKSSEPGKKRISFLALFGVKNSPPNAAEKVQKATKAEKGKKSGKKSSITPGGGRFASDLTKDMNRLKINNKKDSRSSRLIGGAGRGGGGDGDGGGKICKLAAAPKATLSDEFASSSDEWDVNSNGSQDVLNDDELEKRTLRRIQKAARQQQKQQEQKRLRIAQELQRHMEEVEVKQRELEGRGVAVEMILRGEGDDESKSEADLMQEWFNLVYEKNVLVRYESELMVRAKELELEDRHGRLQTSLREKMIIAEESKTSSDREDEERLLEEMLDVVEQRDALVALLEEDRLREQEEDDNLIQLMNSKGYQLSPLSYELGDIS